LTKGPASSFGDWESKACSGIIHQDLHPKYNWRGYLSNWASQFSKKFINQKTPLKLVAKQSKDSYKQKKQGHLYDDEKIESMIRYYKLEGNYESLFRYIKSQNLISEDK
jgi:hypothetical protein